jgi:hypothetical protein
MLKTDKERVVTELASRLEQSETLIVADYRGLTTAELADLRRRLRGHGASFSVVKNTLAKRAAEEAGATGLGLGVEGLAEVHDVEPVLTERGTNRRRRVGLAARNLQLDHRHDFLGHLLFFPRRSLRWPRALDVTDKRAREIRCAPVSD